MVHPHSHRERKTARLSWWLYILDHTNEIVTTLIACLVVYTRSTGVAYAAAGATSCSLSVHFLKRCVRQPRPVIVGGRRKKTYGMPSTHSAVITYLTTYICLACAYLPVHPSLPASPLLSRVAPAVVFVPFASTIVMSRIWLGHHTWPQVTAGCAYGLLLAPVWFGLWTAGLNERGRVVEDMVRVYFP